MEVDHAMNRFRKFINNTFVGLAIVSILLAAMYGVYKYAPRDPFSEAAFFKDVASAHSAHRAR